MESSLETFCTPCKHHELVHVTDTIEQQLQLKAGVFTVFE